MKKKIIYLLVLISSIVFAGQDQYQLVTAHHYNDVWKSLRSFNLDLRYDIGDDMVYIYIQEFVQTVAFKIDKKDRQIMIARLDKYLEWQQKAIEMEVELEKNIGDIYLKGYYELGDDWHNSCKKSCMIRFIFKSQNTKWHQVVFSFGKIQDCNNEYSTHTPEQIYMEYKDVLILKEALTEERLKAVIKEIKKKNLIEDVFK